MSYEFKLSLSYLLPQSGNIDPLRINRVRGLSNSGGADHSMQLAICGIGYIYFYLKTSKILIRAILIALYCLLMFSTVFIARSGFLVEIVILFFSIIFFDKKKLLTILIFLISISLSIFFVIMFLPFIDYLTNDVFSEETLPWFISLFSIFTDGEINSSNKDLISMLYVPDRLDILFFGSGGYQFFLDYARSDSGYVKFIFSIGLIPTVTFIFFLLYSNLKLFYKANKSNFYGILSIFIFMAILLNVKEPFLIKIGTVNMLYLSLFFAWNKLPVTK
ncbi:hypothetical protein [Pseudoalteromonas sp. bablab_jr011]|uniref:hypothetical protein n=1 Tax=Pseudoalteromonas sp. bablab_jr011 TaxID=2755062 RepID=UPI0018F7A0B5|nr:hypothetical protein [Pseudoalteromonas sp. bablab_jr011]